MSKTFESFGKYILLEKIAAGGMAEVFLAKSTGAGGISKFVAIKRILPQYSENVEFVDMFKEEAKIAVNLNHGNVVSIFDFGLERSNFFLVMEYVEGQNLRQVLNHMKKEGKTFSIDQIVYIIKEVAAGLDHAHRCIDGTTGRPLNITHRDMSPQNVMVSFEGEVKIVDFGIAKAESQMEQTRAGTIKGKFGYMSPEQADGQPVDLRTDIFSLGIVLWELLANDRLFTSNSEAGTLRKIRECQVPSLRKINPAVPPELERISNKALAKDKSLRYQTAASFHRDLNRFLNTQYPEFSAQDFSVFMKSVFSQMFIDNRKRLMEFAKATAYDEKTTVTETLTTTNDAQNGNRQNNLPKPLSANSSAENNPNNGYVDESETAAGILDFKKGTASNVDFSVLKARKSSVIKKTSTSISLNGSGTQTGSYNFPYGTQTRIRRQNRKKSEANSFWLMALVVVSVLGGTTWYLYKENRLPISRLITMCQSIGFLAEFCSDRPTQAHPGPSGTVQQASRKPVPLQRTVNVYIDSNPLGAKISIDGKDTGSVTPAILKVEPNKEFSLGLRYDGYAVSETGQKVENDNEIKKVKLQHLSQTGYIFIDVVNGGADPVIIVNGSKISQKPPIKLLPVPADTPVLIQAFNTFSKLSAETTVSVAIDSRKNITLILTEVKQKKTSP